MFYFVRAPLILVDMGIYVCRIVSSSLIFHQRLKLWCFIVLLLKTHNCLQVWLVFNLNKELDVHGHVSVDDHSSSSVPMDPLKLRARKTTSCFISALASLVSIISNVGSVPIGSSRSGPSQKVPSQRQEVVNLLAFSEVKGWQRWASGTGMRWDDCSLHVLLSPWWC